MCTISVIDKCKEEASQLVQARASKHVEVAGCVADTSDVDDVMLPSVNEAIQQPAQEWVEVLTRDDSFMTYS